MPIAWSSGKDKNFYTMSKLKVLEQPKQTRKTETMTEKSDHKQRAYVTYNPLQNKTCHPDFVRFIPLPPMQCCDLKLKLKRKA